MTFISVLDHLEDSEIVNILKLSIGSATLERIASVVHTYRMRPFQFAFGLQVDNVLVGVVAGEMHSGCSATIGHIAVRADQRCRGFGRQLITNLRKCLDLREIVAETDRDAIAFYRQCGFEVASLGEQYPGVERFKCRWRLV